MSDKHTSNSMQERLLESLAKRLKENIEFLCGYLSTICESPIEIMLACALLKRDEDMRLYPYTPLLLCCNEHEKKYNDCDRLLIPQYIWCGKRIDFAIRDCGKFVFVECDGHEFHERTKQQAARDRSKDREVQAAGIPILRFTGSEIFRDPVACADDIFMFIENYNVRTVA